MRDFYKYAAHLANPLLEQKNLSNAFFSGEEEKPAFSRLLEPTFQEICATYNRPEEKETASSIFNATWLKRPMTTAFWHSYLLKLSESRHRVAISFLDSEDNKEEAILTRFVIFYAYRLRNKSWQVKGELDRSIRYFHLQGELSGNRDFDLLYWVKGDDNELISGEFLPLSSPYLSISPINLGEIKTRLAKETQ